MIKIMDGLPMSKASIDFYDLLTDSGKIEIGYGTCVDDSTIIVYGALGGEVCIVINLKAIF
jgi:hypothetical protein